MKVKGESEVAQSCPTLSDPMDCSLPGSLVHGIFQARVLEWVAIAFSAASAGDIRDTVSIPGLVRSPGGGHDNPLQYSCLENHGQRSLAGYSPWSCKEQGKIEAT